MRGSEARTASRTPSQGKAAGSSREAQAGAEGGKEHRTQDCNPRALMLLTTADAPSALGLSLLGDPQETRKISTRSLPRGHGHGGGGEEAGNPGTERLSQDSMTRKLLN